MAQVLGKITATEGPRGPDVAHRISVPRAWFAEAAWVEVELPRNLACAACGGGGCDACARAGALSLRGRQEPAELVTVQLPRRTDLEGSGPGAIVLRISGHGGLPAEDEDLPRGTLHLTVLAWGEAEPSAGVMRAESPVEVDEAAATPPAVPWPSEQPRWWHQPGWWLVAGVLAAAAGYALLR